MDKSAVFSFDGRVFREGVAHGGRNVVLSARVRDGMSGSPCRFIDLVVVPPGATVGAHRHSTEDEEIYVVTEGTGRVILDGQEFDVGPGDTIVNRPGGTHSLENVAAKPLKMVVVDIAVPTPSAKQELGGT